MEDLEPGSELAEGIARAILDGRGLNWETLSVGTLTPYAAEFQVLDQIATFHRTAAALPESRPELPCQLGSLALKRSLGVGAYGEVFEAWDPQLERAVAVKLLHVGFSSPHQVLAEGRLLARVHHPNVVTVYGVDEFDGRVALLTEFIDGKTLAEIVADSGPLPLAEVMAVGTTLCGALGAVHAAGLLHRDVKPQNVMRETGGRIVLMDFGAGHLGLASGPSGGVAGTPLYIAPEIWAGGTATHRSDIYSLGVLLYHLLTGTHPLRGTGVAALREAHRRNDRVPLKEVRRDIPARVAAVIEQAIDPNPDRRHANARAFEAALVGATARPANLRRWAAAALVVFAVGGATAVWRWQQLNTPTDPTRTYVLVAGFKNETSHAEFSGTLQYGVQRELAASTRLRPLESERLDALMASVRYGPNAEITEDFARVIAAREPDVSAIMSGRIREDGDRYLLTATLRSMPGGHAIAEESVVANSAGAVPLAIHRLTLGVRQKAGDQIDATASDGLLNVSTASVTAFQSYTRAVNLGNRGDWGGALAHAREAVQQDAGFAAAWIWLAYSLSNTGATRSEVVAAAERAKNEVAGSTEPERLWVLGSYASITRQDSEAATIYGELLRIQPDHYWAVSNLSQRSADPVHARRLAEVRPHDLASQFIAAYTLWQSGADPRDIDPYIARMRGLITEVTPENAAIRTHKMVSWAVLYPAHRMWLTGHPTTARSSIEEALQLRLDENRSAFVRFSASQLLLALGQLDRATQVIASLGDYPVADLLTARIRLVQGDITDARERLKDLYPHRLTPENRKYNAPFTRAIVRGHWELLVWTLLQAGLLDDATAMNESLSSRNLETRPGEDAARIAVGGYIALANGDARGAVAKLRSVTEQFKTYGFQARDAESLNRFYRCSTALADALLKTGDRAAATEVLRVSTDAVPRGDPSFNYGFERLIARARLAALYREAGRVTEAATLQREIESALATSDPGFAATLLRVEAGPLFNR